MKLKWHKYEITDGSGFDITKMDTGAAHKKPGDAALETMLKEDVEKISALQYRLYAEKRQSVLIVLQGMDSAGKDGTIKHILSGVNPQGVAVYSFKHPSDNELEHSYLWRHTIKLPEKGQIAIFNRSHYENVLISKVHPKIVLSERLPNVYSEDDIDKSFWRSRYRQINDFEKTVFQDGTQILKFFLHLSKEEQRNRFLDRIDHKEKHWKFSSADITERGYWDQYQQAYEDAIRHTSTPDAPWYVIPADNKWYTHLLIGNIILEKLKKMSPEFPSISDKENALMETAKVQLEKEGRV
jgi:PPK2 family polyphosphate:nucleotide phosphotransferase